MKFVRLLGLMLCLFSASAWAFEKPNAWVNVRDFGARCNGRDNDTEAFNRAVAAGKQVFVPPGDCIVDGVVLVSNTEIYGDGDNSTLYVPVDARWGLSVNPGSGGTPNPADNARNIIIRNLQIRGAVEVGGFSEHRHLLNLHAVSDLLVDNVTFKGFRGDGIYLGSSNTPGTERHNQRIVIRNSRFDGINGANRNGISVIDVDGLLIENSSFQNMTRHDMPGAIDLEPNAFPFHIIRNVTIRGNTFRNIGGNAGAVSLYYPSAVVNEPQLIEVSSNRFEKVRANAMMFYRVKAPSSQSPFHQILLADNVVSECGRPFSLYGIKGVSILDNSFSNCYGAAMLGYTAAHHAVHEVTLENTTFDLTALSDNACLSLFTVEAATIRSNRFADCSKIGTPGYAVALNVGKSSGLQLIGNRFVNTQGRLSYAVQVDSRHLLNMASNLFEGNVIDPSLRIDLITNRAPALPLQAAETQPLVAQ